MGYLTRVDGAPVASPEGALTTATLSADVDLSQPVLLRWNAFRARYETRLRDPLREGPADLRLMLGGAVERGSTDRLPVHDALTDSGVPYAATRTPRKTEPRLEQRAQQVEPRTRPPAAKAAALAAAVACALVRGGSSASDLGANRRGHPRGDRRRYQIAMRASGAR